MADPIRSALGLSEEFRLSSGATIPVAPCGIRDLSRGMQLYANTFQKFTLHQMFLPGNEAAQEDLHNLLLLASGNGDLTGDERDQALDGVFTKFNDIGDFGSEVFRYVQRFLRLVPRDTKTENLEREVGHESEAESAELG